MYGDITGLSRQMVKQLPKIPEVSAAREILFEGECIQINRERGNYPILQRILPKTESLKDCMDRTITYFVVRIAKDSVDQEKRVLISSSENAIRGLLTHLCDIPENEITGIEIPSV
jgi:2,3-bisphosphoglycerate-dependent phosphoglycerate mutase